ncbi:MAG: metalloenzyme [Anaerolineae bacterium]|nr:MAG: metalloenzyme [Anaerolineae bacterium]
MLFLFLDGVGLGPDDPERNPFSAADMPYLLELLEGRRLVEGSAPFEGQRATLLAVDARLGVEGAPQSATGQAALLTGENVPSQVGEHYGPKPNPAVAEIVRRDNLFKQVLDRGGSAALLNGYPPRYFEAIERGVRLYSSIPLAATSAGLELMTVEDMQDGRAFSADFTGVGWSKQPDFPSVPTYDPAQAGRQLARAAEAYDMAWFDFWPSDFAGHRGEMSDAVALLEKLDAVLGGLVAAWEGRSDLIVVSSDHGNLEDLSRRGHTLNPVPAMLIGPLEMRRNLASGLEDLASFAPAILETLFGSS